LLFLFFFCWEIVTGSYGAAVGANTKPTSGCRAVFTWRGRPKTRKEKKKKENKTQIIIMTIIIMEEEEEEGGPFSLLFFLSFTWPAFSFLDDQIQWLRGRGENCYHRVKSQGKKKKRKEKKEIEREQQQLSDGPHSRNNKERLSRHLVRLLFSLLSLSLSLSLGGWPSSDSRQANRKEREEEESVVVVVVVVWNRRRERERENKVVVGFGGRPVLAPPPPPRHNTQPKNRNCFLLFFLFLCLFVWPLDRVDTSDSTILVWPRSTNFVPTQSFLPFGLFLFSFFLFSLGLSCLNSLAKGSGQEKKSGASFSSVTA
jgi:hypothetical protein